MRIEFNISKIKESSVKFWKFGVFCILVAFVFLLAACFWPIQNQNEAFNLSGKNNIRKFSREKNDIQSLTKQIVSRQLIKASQVQAAVKDTGLAQKLVKKLKLQGVVQMGGDLVAYIQIDKQGVKSVKQDEKILDFVVKKIQTGKVTLSLQGVEVELGH